MNTFKLTVAALLLSLSTCFATAQSTPAMVHTVIPLNVFSQLHLSNNSSGQIASELTDTNLLALIAKSCDLKDFTPDSLHLRVEDQDYLGMDVPIQQDPKFSSFTKALLDYADARGSGHTKAYLLTALANQPSSDSIKDPDLRILHSEHPRIPITWLKHLDSGTTTNNAGVIASRSFTIQIVNDKTTTNETTHIPKSDEIQRWTSFLLVDGEIAWIYTLQFKPDGSFDELHETKADAQEYNPKYKDLFKKIREEVTAEMKQKGSYGQFGSIHTFWFLKKEKLKAQGINWRSPSELNPGTSYD